MSDYDPKSHDAMFATIMSELKAMRTTQLENKSKLNQALDRVSALEAFKILVVGAAAGVSALVASIAAAVKWFVDEISK